VMGAIKTMTFRYYWQGSTEQIDAVTERMTKMYYDYQEQVGCMICEMVAECFADGNEALIEALAEAIRNNPLLQAAIADAMAQNGSYTPGRSLTPGQSAASLLPENVKDEFGNCVDDNLWGAMLYLVQSGNRLITDFFDVLEAASNTIESMEIISKAIPAAGDYISSAAGFADQLQENISEGYAAAYTEAYEQGLACDLFCLARSTCELSLDEIIAMLNNRLAEPLSIGDFGEIMAGIASGTWVGDELADVAFMCFFGAIKFGQQFGDTLGVRPLPVLMSLGADQLSSNNWETLCDCGASECYRWDYLNPETWSFTDSGEAEPPLWREAAAGTNMQGSITGLALTGYASVTFEWDLSPFDVVGYSYIRVHTDAGTHSYSGGFTGDVAHQQAIIPIPGGETIQGVEYLITGGFAESAYQLRFVEACP